MPSPNAAETEPSNTNLDAIVDAARAAHGPRGAALDPRKIARVIGRLVNRGEIGPGSQLPTVRALARGLRVSPSTVSEAWRILRAHEVITTDRRRGTVVRTSRGDVEGRYWNVPASPGAFEFDLSSGTPDPSLLPSLTGALERVQVDLTMNSYLDSPVVPALEKALLSSWPYVPERLTIVDGAQDGLDRIINAHVHLGDTVVVEDPTFPPIIDMLELRGARVIGVRCDAQGIVPGELECVIAQQPTALFLQPRAQNPIGVAMSESRRDALADILSETNVLVVEDDHSGSISGAELHSIGTPLPNQVLHIRSFSKSHGPDLRLAALSGPAELLDPVIHRRHLGPSWTSRLLQQVLLELLESEAEREHIEHATAVYAMRRHNFIEQLAQRGVPESDLAAAGTGMNVWLPVTDEQHAVTALAAQGIGVAPGRPFMVNATDQDYIRITTATLATPTDAKRVADAVATSFDMN